MKKGVLGGCLPVIRLYDIADIQSIDVNSNGLAEIKPTGITPIELECAPKTVTFTEDAKTDDAQGSYYEVKVKGQVSGMENELTERLRLLCQRRYIALVSLISGGTKVLGSPDCGLQFAYDTEVSKDYKTNIYEVTLSGMAAEEGPFLAPPRQASN